MLLMHYLLYFQFKVPATEIENIVIGYLCVVFVIMMGLIQLLHGKEYMRINEFRGVSYTFGLFGVKRIIGPDKTLTHLYQSEQE